MLKLFGWYALQATAGEYWPRMCRDSQEGVVGNQRLDLRQFLIRLER